MFTSLLIFLKLNYLLLTPL